MNNVAAVMRASVNIVAVTTMRSRFAFGAACATTLPTTYNGAPDDRGAQPVDAGAAAVGPFHREPLELVQERRIDVRLAVHEGAGRVEDDLLVEGGR